MGSHLDKIYTDMYVCKSLGMNTMAVAVLTQRTRPDEIEQ